MSDRPIPKIPEGVLSEEQIAKINGGMCSAQEWNDIFAGLRENYDTLVDFTSYVIEQVAGP